MHFLLSRRQQKKVPKKNAFVFYMYSVFASVLRTPSYQITVAEFIEALVAEFIEARTQIL